MIDGTAVNDAPVAPRPANVDPAGVWVWLVCTDCEHAVHIAMAAGTSHVSVGAPCYCGVGTQLLLRTLQEQARLGRGGDV